MLGARYSRKNRPAGGDGDRLSSLKLLMNFRFRPSAPVSTNGFP